MPQPEQLYPELVNRRPQPDSGIAEIAYQQILVDVLLEWETVCAPRQRPVTADMIELYASSLADIKATPDELKAARKSLLLVSTFFPTVAEIANWIKANRSSNAYEGWISALDGNGGTILCPRYKAHGGYYRPFPPDGEANDGRGCAAMAEYADIRRDLEKKRDALGVPVNEQGVRPLSTATQKQLDEAGVPRYRAMGTAPQALPARTPYMERKEIEPEKVVEILGEVGNWNSLSEEEKRAARRGA